MSFIRETCRYARVSVAREQQKSAERDTMFIELGTNPVRGGQDTTGDCRT